MNVLVTGGSGFLGKAIVRRLLARGDTVRTYSRGDYPELQAEGVETLRGDVADAGPVADAVDGCDAVIHAAAKPGVWGAYDEYYRCDVVGTRNVIEACRRKGVTRLVYTSSPSVVFDGKDQEGWDESAPYPKRYLSHYPKTKAMAERAVLEANSQELCTVALRPHLIWGPDDNQLVPRVIARAKAGRLRLVGDEHALVDAVYIDNAAQAHVLAVDRLAPDAACAGNVYFVTNHEPWPMGKILNGILAAAGLPPVTKHVSPRLAYTAGALLELAYTVLRKKEEPFMTRFVARQLATAHWYDNTAAKRDLGYEPEVSMDEGMGRLAQHLRGKSNGEVCPNSHEQR